jgi:hypothetical protein
MSTNNWLLRCVGISGLALLATSAVSQSAPTSRLHCHSVGYSPAEPLGDREGHSISIGEVACRVEGGPGDGGTLTGTTIYEWDKTNATLLSGTGITRKPGATSAYQHIEGKASLVVIDGKVSGIAGSGRGRYTMATGAASSLAGKTYTYTFKSVGPGQILVEVRQD